MKIFDWYIFRNLLMATLFITFTLAIIVMLTQSLRFLELVIESGASASSFWLLTLLTLPRFFEVILPLALMAATLFIYSRMTADAELTAIRATGMSPAALAWPAIVLSLMASVLLWSIVMYVAPRSLAGMQELRQYIKTQISSAIFRDGVFNQITDGLTIYIKERKPDGTLVGLMIHDTRDESVEPATIIAQKGAIVNDQGRYNVLVYEGSRQSYNPERQTLSRLDFERYSIDLPDSNPVDKRWQEPDERTIFELLATDFKNAIDRENRRELTLEVHKRIIGPLLAPLFTVIACIAMMGGASDRRGNAKRIIIAVATVIAIQSLYLASLSYAQKADWGLLLIYSIVILPLIAGSLMLGNMAYLFKNRFFLNLGKGWRA